MHCERTTTIFAPRGWLMGSPSEYEAAYFTLLRAREELSDLLRYDDLLTRERERLASVAQDTTAFADALPTSLRRPTAATTKPLLEALGRRREVLEQERDRMPDRIEQAQAFVEACEEEVAQLRAG